MNARHVQAATILECLRRRGIWVTIRCRRIDLVPPPGKAWKRRFSELLNTSRHLEWELMVWLRWERTRESREERRAIKGTVTFKPFNYTLFDLL